MNAWEKPGLTPEERAAAAVDHVPRTLAAIERRVASALRAAVREAQIEVGTDVTERVRAAVEQERAVCAVACETVMVNDDNHDWREAAKCCAEVIRARSEVK